MSRCRGPGERIAPNERRWYVLATVLLVPWRPARWPSTHLPGTTPCPGTTGTYSSGSEGALRAGDGPIADPAGPSGSPRAARSRSSPNGMGAMTRRLLRCRCHAELGAHDAGRWHRACSGASHLRCEKSLGVPKTCSAAEGRLVPSHSPPAWEARHDCALSVRWGIGEVAWRGRAQKIELMMSSPMPKPAPMAMARPKPPLRNRWSMPPPGAKPPCPKPPCPKPPCPKPPWP